MLSMQAGGLAAISRWLIHLGWRYHRLRHGYDLHPGGMPASKIIVVEAESLPSLRDGHVSATIPVVSPAPRGQPPANGFQASGLS